MNVDELLAIDIHTHAETSTRLAPDAVSKESLEARGRYFRYAVQHPTMTGSNSSFRISAGERVESLTADCHRRRVAPGERGDPVVGGLP